MEPVCLRGLAVGPPALGIEKLGEIVEALRDVGMVRGQRLFAYCLGADQERLGLAIPTLAEENASADPRSRRPGSATPYKMG